MRPFQITQSLLGMVGATAGVIGILVALFLIQPLLISLLLLALFPTWLIAVVGSRAFYDFSFGMTPNDRRRAYVRWTMTRRDSAKEVIAFGLGPFLRQMWERLYAERIAELRKLVRRRVLIAVVGSVATALLTVGPVVVLAYLVVSGRMSLPQALAGATAMILLRPSLSGLVFSAAQLYESSLFLEDYADFLRLKPALDGARPARPAPHGFRRLAVEEVTFTYRAALVRPSTACRWRSVSGRWWRWWGKTALGRRPWPSCSAACIRPSPDAFSGTVRTSRIWIPPSCAARSPSSSRTSCSTCCWRAKTSAWAATSASMTGRGSAGRPSSRARTPS
jgi:ABC-type multidrug transport system fused ATPase/permease subunit